MPIGRPPISIRLNEEEKEKLLSMCRSLSLPHSLVCCAQIVLACLKEGPIWRLPSDWG